MSSSVTNNNNQDAAQQQQQSAVTDEEAYKRQLMSRQLYSVGAEAQKKYGQCDVLLVGITGLGLEIAKNLVLSGIRSLTILDESNVEYGDLSSMFYASPADVGKPRTAVLIPKICELNRFVKVSAAPAGSILPNGLISPDLIRSHQIAVFVDKRSTLLAEQNAQCRSLGCKMICAESRGVACSTFVDGGAEPFTVLDKNGEETVLCVVADISSEGIIYMSDDKKHELEEGDLVYFLSLPGIHGELLNSYIPEQKSSSRKQKQQQQDAAEQQPRMKMIKVKRIVNPWTIQIDLPEGWDTTKVPNLVRDGGSNSVGGYLQTTKQPITINFKPLEESVKNPDFCGVIDDDPKMFCEPTLHTIFRAIHQVADKIHSDNVNNAIDDVIKIAKEIDADIDEALLRDISVAFHGNLNAMATFLGGIVAQEVLKLASGKYHPLVQWFYFDVRELVQLRPQIGASEFAPRNSRYDGQIAVLGNTIQQKILNSSAFIVGAGALGAELLKNAAMSGLGCGQKGKITITDMDNIEISNLSRQFLFREKHVKQSKSKVAAQAAREMNNDMNIQPMELKVGAETENIFNEDFWKSQTAVINALDNVPARLYVDEQCVMHQRPFFESGTLGPKFHVQDVIPYLTENYGATRDPPEKDFAICTLKNFPNSIEHTIQWAKEAFGNEFTAAPTEVNNFIHNNASWRAAVARDPSSKAGAFKQIVTAVKNPPKTWEECVAWARLRFEDYFVNEIKQLMHNLPLGSERDGKPVWGGAKRPPTEAKFDPENELHFDFIVAAASLRATVFNVEHPTNDIDFNATKKILDSVQIPQWKPRQVDVAVKDDDAAKQQSAAADDAEVTENDLPDPSSVSHLKLSPQEFEKDDDTNFHVDFMTAVSNLRATNYNIPTVSRDRTKFIAGKIIPAMITTTASATGLVCLELLKYLIGADKLIHYRDAHINIALPLVTFNPPAPAAKAKSYTTSSGQEISFTNWDRIDIGDGSRDMKLQEVVDYIKEKYDIDTDMISTSTAKVVYMGPFTKKEKLQKTITEILADLGAPVKDDDEAVCLIANGTVNDEEVDIPAIQYRFRKSAAAATAAANKDTKVNSD